MLHALVAQAAVSAGAASPQLSPASAGGAAARAAEDTDRDGPAAAGVAPSSKCGAPAADACAAAEGGGACAGATLEPEREGEGGRAGGAEPAPRPPPEVVMEGDAIGCRAASLATGARPTGPHNARACSGGLHVAQDAIECDDSAMWCGRMQREAELLCDAACAGRALPCEEGVLDVTAMERHMHELALAPRGARVAPPWPALAHGARGVDPLPAEPSAPCALASPALTAQAGGDPGSGTLDSPAPADDNARGPFVTLLDAWHGARPPQCGAGGCGTGGGPSMMGLMP